MAKMGCAQCGKAMKKGGVKKMATGGMKTTVGSKTAKTFIAGMPNSGSTGPNYQGINSMKKGGASSVINRAVSAGCRNGMVKDANGKCVMERKMAKGGSSNFGMLSVKAGVDNNPNPTAADRIAGAKMQYGGTSTSKKLTRLGTKVEKKTAAGKTVGKGLQKRYDKAVDKVIARGLTKAKRGGIKK
jgi:hypothetical protein